MNSISVRLANEDDFKSILNMPPYTKSQIDTLFQEEILVAENNGEIYGAVSVSHKDILYVPGDWSEEVWQRINNFSGNISGGWISKLYVVPESRQQGIATKLIQDALKRLSEKKFAEAYAGVNVKNEFSQVSEHIFEKNGFQRIGSCICFLSTGNCRGILFKKVLEPKERKRKDKCP